MVFILLIRKENAYYRMSYLWVLINLLFDMIVIDGFLKNVEEPSNGKFSKVVNIMDKIVSTIILILMIISIYRIIYMMRYGICIL